MTAPSNRRLAAARRAIARQKEHYSLFDAAGIAVQEGFVDESPEKRIEKRDTAWDNWLKERRIRHFGNIRLALKSIKPEHRQEVKFL